MVGVRGGVQDDSPEDFLLALRGTPEPPDPDRPLRGSLQAISRPSAGGKQAPKKNFSQSFSEVAAVLLANRLRGHFDLVTPLADRSQQEMRVDLLTGEQARLDVTCWMEGRLHLVLSLKSIGFEDLKSSRFTKNVKGRRKELEGEVWSLRLQVLNFVGLLFMPVRAAMDGPPSSFAHAVQSFRRAGFPSYVALYEPDGDRMGALRFFPSSWEPPQKGPPSMSYSLSVDQVAERLLELGIPQGPLVRRLLGL